MPAAPVFDTRASPRTVTTVCSVAAGSNIAAGSNFETSGVDFGGVRLSITAKDKCGTALAPVTATVNVRVAPYIDVRVASAPAVCETATRAVAVFNYTAVPSTPNPTWIVESPSGCNNPVVDTGMISSSQQPYLVHVCHI